MPLIKSSSPKFVGRNIEAEQSAGRPHRQAVAIALNTQREAARKGMAAGGAVRQENTMANDSHYPGGKANALPKYNDKDVKGPVPMHHRLKLGHTDIQENPYGDGKPSHEKRIANSRVTW